MDRQELVSTLLFSRFSTITHFSSLSSSLAAVRAAKYSVGALEIGGECWGSDEIRDGAKKLDASKCAQKCNDVRSLSSYSSHISYTLPPPTSALAVPSFVGFSLKFGIDTYGFL
jgi:hypothetical protein